MSVSSPTSSATMRRGHRGSTRSRSSDGPRALIKVFRVVQNGENPDVSTLAALTRGGSRRTPALLGWLSGQWPTADGGTASGDLAIMQDFVPGAEDGWELAVSAAERGE